MRIKTKIMCGLLTVATLGAMIAVASAPAYASTTYRHVYVIDPRTGTHWYMSNCNNKNGICTLTTTSKYYGEYSFQSPKTYDGQTYYQMVDKATGECITLEGVDTDLVESTCGIPSDDLTNQYWHYNGTSQESTNLYAIEVGQSSESCMLAWAADPADSTYTYTCGEGWNGQWHQPVA